MTQPDIDVLVCVRDRVGTLGRALDSARAAIVTAEVVAQVTVLDGGSTDGSVDVARSRPGVRVVGQTGRGLAGARNEALAATSAPLVAWLDSDDVWPVESLAVRLAALHSDPTADVVTGSVAFEPLADLKPSRYQGRWDRTSRGLTPGAWLVRRATFDRVGSFDERLRIGADPDWFSRAVDAGCRIIELDQVMLVKGVGSDNASHDVVTYRDEMLDIVRRHHRRRNPDDGGRSPDHLT